MIPRTWRLLGACAMLLGCPKDPDAVNPLPADVVVATDDGAADAVTLDVRDVAPDGAAPDTPDAVAVDARDVVVVDTPDGVVTDTPVVDVPAPDAPDAGAPSPVRITGAIRAVGAFADPSRSLRVVGTLETVTPVCDRTRGLCITGAVSP